MLLQTYSYNYILPKGSIAHTPLSVRDESKLFVFETKTGKVIHDYFYNLHKYIPEKSVFVLNKTKVVKARVWLYKETGGKVECFFLTNEIKDLHRIPCIMDRKLEAGKSVSTIDGTFVFKIVEQAENTFYLEPQFPTEKFYEFLEEFGEVPLPKYIKNEDVNDELHIRYNTVFADQGRSLAAPTASLHFTERVFKDLKEKNCTFESVYLDVGLGTFKTPTREDIEKGKLHTEPVSVSAKVLQNIENAKKEGKNIVCVGTTVVRSLESLKIKNVDQTDDVMHFDTDIFIKPPHKFTYPDILITNFHLPETSLMMLVQAFLEYKGSDMQLVDLYKQAIEHHYRFYSFGDVMLIV
jgi:S-adenosylmethionine:tRNA ribosyltransferase-isomerase